MTSSCRPSSGHAAAWWSLTNTVQKYSSTMVLTYSIQPTLSNASCNRRIARWVAWEPDCPRSQSSIQTAPAELHAGCVVCLSSYASSLHLRVPTRLLPHCLLQIPATSCFLPIELLTMQMTRQRDVCFRQSDRLRALGRCAVGVLLTIAGWHRLEHWEVVY